jgi:hypothetical protein
MSSGSLGAMAAAGVLLTACTTTPSPSRPGPVDESVLRTTGSFEMNLPLNRSDAVFTDTLRFDPARAWTELPAVYRALGLPVNESESARRRIAAIAFQPRRIDGERVSLFLDCGRGITAGENADSYQVHLSVETRLVADPSDPARAMVQSTLNANARPRAISGNPVPCDTRGRLERRIVETLQARLAASDG